MHPITSVHKQMGMFFQNSFYDILIEVLYPNRAMSRLAQTVEYVSDFFLTKLLLNALNHQDQSIQQLMVVNFQ